MEVGGWGRSAILKRWVGADLREKGPFGQELEVDKRVSNAGKEKSIPDQG